MRILSTVTGKPENVPEHPPIDFDQMERDMRQAEQIENSLRQAVPQAIQRQTAPYPNIHTALQIIAQSIIALRWAEAEAMGKAIADLMTKDGAAQGLTGAIQAWASKWESFDS